ncbi:MAG: hypothetical protein JWN66_3425 [Sphingomonas bacterium]|nr:hypothetical protein [Sphingomonas bacterium]
MGKKKGGPDARLFLYRSVAESFERVDARTRPFDPLPLQEGEIAAYFFSGAIVIFTVSPELPGKPVNIASVSRGTR